MDFVVCTRKRRGNGYSNSMASRSNYLRVPTGATQLQTAHEVRKADWFADLVAASGATATDMGDVLVYVHGFNTATHENLHRTRLIANGLKEQGFTGAVCAFDWPSEGRASAGAYPDDRKDALAAAQMFVADALAPISQAGAAGRNVRVHVMAHSMGAYLLRQAFDYADDVHALRSLDLRLGELALVAADLSSASLAQGNAKSKAMVDAFKRVTNYFSRADDVLGFLRRFVAKGPPRLGRVGLPDNAPATAVDVYCSHHYMQNLGDYGHAIDRSHRWYFDSSRFYEDLSLVLAGRGAHPGFPTRGVTNLGTPYLV